MHNHNHHSHGHSHDHSSNQDNAAKNIGFAFVLNLFFCIVELVGGLLTNSIAILSDALHDFGDAVSLGISWIFQKKSKRHGDQKYSYGYKRYSLMGSIFLSVVLMVSSIFIIIEASKRIISPEEVNSRGMFFFAIAGIIINGAAALRLKKGSSLNEKAVFLHIMEDVLGWVAVLVASIIMRFVDFPIIDPILSIAITIWVAVNVWKNLRSTLRIMLQAVPEDIDTPQLSEELIKIEGIESIHDLHIWTLDGETHVMTLHAVFDPKIMETKAENIEQFTQRVEALKKEIRELSSNFHIEHVTVEFEPSGDNVDCEYKSGKKD